MDRLIEELFYADIDRGAEQRIRRLTLGQAAAMVDQWEGVLYQHLPQGVKGIFQEYATAYGEYASILAMENFGRGFRLGANFMQAVNKEEGAQKMEE